MLCCMYRKLDDLGRIALPKEFRRKLGMKEGDPIAIWIEDDKIILKLGRKEDN